MPAVSKKQQRFMGAELARKRAGKKTKTGMNESQLQDFARGGASGFNRKYGQRKRRMREKQNG